MWGALLWQAFGWEAVPDVAGGRAYGWEKSVTILVTNVSGEPVDDASEHYAGGGYVEYNADRSTRYEGLLPLYGRTLRAYVDFIQPWVVMTREDGLVRSGPLGLFAVGMSVDTGDYTGTEHVYTLRDMTHLAHRTIITRAYTVHTGDDVATEAATILAGAGITLLKFPASGETAASDITIPAGTTRYEAAKICLNHGGLIGPYMEPSGYVTYREPLDLDDVEPFAVWTGDVILGPIRRVPRDETFANVIVVTNDDPNSTPISQRAYNRDASSPGSTVSLGFEIGRKIAVPTVKSNGEALKLARQYVSEAASYYRTIAMDVEMDVTIVPDSAVVVAYDEAGIDDAGFATEHEPECYCGRWWVRTFRIGLDEDDGVMPVECNQVVVFGHETEGQSLT